MPAKLAELVSKGLAHPPSNFENLIQYEVYMGSAAYGCSSDTSDIDVYGWAIPPKNLIFPHLQGEIEGFGPKGQRFKEYEEHGIMDKNAAGGEGKNYDYKIYNITRFFNLVMGNNPNMVDSLFVPERCVLFQTPLGQHVRENRHIFLSQKVVHTFRGYAYQQLHKIRTKHPEAGKRADLIAKHGYDTKFAYHIVRLLEEARQILTLGDLDLEASRELLKAIRRGDWKLEDIERYFTENEPQLLKMASESKLPHKPPLDKIKSLLVHCLDVHFGGLEGAFVNPDKYVTAVAEIREILDRL